MKKLLILILCICCLLTSCSASAQPKDVLTDESALRVMSFNICGWNYKNIKNLAPQVIAEYSPDLVGLQECTYDWYKKLSRELPEYGFVGVGREDGTLSKSGGESCGILYKKDRFTLEDSGTFWLSETPGTPSQGWDGDYIRICTWAIFTDNTTRTQFALVNTHLENIDDGTGAEAQEKGAQMVADKVLALDMPVIVTGDMNIEKTSSVYGMLLTSGLRDTQDAAELSMTGDTYHGSAGEPGEHIDYVFVNGGVSSVLTYKIVEDIYDGQYPSDHYPIYADIKF